MSPQSRFLPLLLGFLIAVGPVSVDMYLPAFPTIAAQLGDPAAPQLTLAAYFAGLAVGQMTQGALSDRIGRRLPVAFGLALYSLASIGCALSHSTDTLCLYRALAAFGASAAIVIPRAMVRDLATGTEAARLFSRLMLVMGVAPVIAPAIGSFVVLAASWRMIFLIAAVYGVVALVLMLRFMPDTLPPERRTRIGLMPVVVRYGAILVEPGFITHALTGSLAISALFAYVAGTPEVFIGMYHWGVLGYAAIFAVNAAAYIGFNQLNPYLVARHGIGKVITVAIASLVAATIVLALLAIFPQRSAIPFFLALLACELGFGLILPSSMVGALARHQAHAGSASALMGTIQYLGGAISGILVGALADGTARPLAFTMLASAVGAAIAAYFRPPQPFHNPAPTEQAPCPVPIPASVIPASAIPPSSASRPAPS
jgi:MFS transporter, DHA1 family, multidrug resistance protein